MELVPTSKTPQPQAHARQSSGARITARNEDRPMALILLKNVISKFQSCEVPRHAGLRLKQNTNTRQGSANKNGGELGEETARGRRRRFVRPFVGSTVPVRQQSECLRRVEHE